MLSTAQFAVEDTAELRGPGQLKETLDSLGAKTDTDQKEGYSGYVLVAIPLRNGTWCPSSGVVTGYTSLPSLNVQDVESVGRRI